MKNLIYFLIFSINLLSCNTSSKGNINLNNKYLLENKKDSLRNTDIATKLIMTSSGSIEQGKDTIINEIKFTVVKKENITFLSTRDEKFKTPEGYRVGNKLMDISKHYKDKIYKEPGFGYFIKLDSHWILGFCEGKSCTNHAPIDNSIVKWIIKK